MPVASPRTAAAAADGARPMTVYPRLVVDAGEAAHGGGLAGSGRGEGQLHLSGVTGHGVDQLALVSVELGAVELGLHERELDVEWVDGCVGRGGRRLRRCAARRPASVGWCSGRLRRAGRRWCRPSGAGRVGSVIGSRSGVRLISLAVTVSTRCSTTWRLDRPVRRRRGPGAAPRRTGARTARSRAAASSRR